MKIDSIKNYLSSTHGPAMYGVFQGLLVAVTYIILKSSGQYGGLPEFSIAVSIVALLHIVRSPTDFFTALKSRSLVLRGVLLGLSQIFACLALIKGDASTAVISGTLGGILGAVLGNLLLKEKLTRSKYLALGICFMGASLNPALLSVTLLAVVGGAIKGGGSVLTRKLMVQKVSAAQTVGATCAVAALVALPSNWALGIPLTAFSISAQQILLLTAAIFLIQYSVCYLYTVSDTQRASAYTLARIPFVVFFEWVFFHESPPGLRVVSAGTVIAGALLLAWLDTKEKRSSRHDIPKLCSDSGASR